MRNRYSFLIKPLSLISDLITILSVTYFIGDVNYLNIEYIAFMWLFWSVTALINKYYNVFRFTLILRIISLSVTQYISFTIGFFAFFGIFREGNLVGNQFLVLGTTIAALFTLKLIIYFSLKIYRNFGNNFRKVVLIEMDNSAKKIVELFENQSYLGYQYLGFFSDKQSGKRIGTIKESFDFILKNEVDEIYCCLSKLHKDVVNEVTKFGNTNNIAVKLIPEAKELYSKNRKAEYYNNTLSVIKVERLPFEYLENYLVKRIFDVIFSILVCVLVLSWLVPILWVFIRLESKGSTIFKQQREGLNGEKFTCYKFRSMKINSLSDKVHASENDSRVTNIGKFMRKTSIDELPQFFNVLKGDMSVVGPRPHLESLSVEYQKDVDDYLRRHAVKPGITGLAQVSGYRGEIKKKSDIKNRVRLDIFYIENWSFFLDIKIILQTVFNVFKGEEKAY